MNILAHRGLWYQKEEKNTLEALTKGLDKGYGLETDIRDLNGKLVVSHDMPLSDSAIPIEKLLEHYSSRGCTSTLGLNIKSDGLQNSLLRLLEAYKIENYFVFDMSIPDGLGYQRLKMPTFIRESDLESYPKLKRETQGVWLDELRTPWINATIIKELAAETQAVCIVSPELHGRPHISQWEEIKKALQLGCPSSKLMICTDFPEEAERFFE
jgi:hypothetical protein